MAMSRGNMEKQMKPGGKSAKKGKKAPKGASMPPMAPPAMPFKKGGMVKDKKC